MPVGAPKGNKNAIKSRPWTEAIRRALARSEGTVDKGLDRLADQLVKAALKKDDRGAMEAIADRVEGKAIQAVELSGPGGGAIESEVTLDVSGLTLEQQRALASIKLPNE